MKHIKPFVLFENLDDHLPSDLTEIQKEFLKKYTLGTWSVNPSTGLVDIDGYFDCSRKLIENFMGIQFGEVTRSFDCELTQLTSLEGSPRFVGGTFRCNNNSITSLEGSPQTVGGDFLCHNNSLSSIKGAPRKVGEDFWCNNNVIETLEGGPDIVGKDFECENNLLTSLKGSPKTIPGDFQCYGNSLISLEGAPQTVGRFFHSSYFRLDPGKWNMEGWVEVLKTGSEEAKKLISTLSWLQPDLWNSKLKEEPKATTLQMVSFWDYLPSNIRDEIQIPSNLKDGFESLLDLERAGIF